MADSRDQRFDNINQNVNYKGWKLMKEYLVEDKDKKQRTIWTTMNNKQALLDMGYKILTAR